MKHDMELNCDNSSLTAGKSLDSQRVLKHILIAIITVKAVYFKLQLSNNHIIAIEQMEI